MPSSSGVYSNSVWKKELPSSWTRLEQDELLLKDDVTPKDDLGLTQPPKKEKEDSERTRVVLLVLLLRSWSSSSSASPCMPLQMEKERLELLRRKVGGVTGLLDWSGPSILPVVVALSFNLVGFRFGLEKSG